MKELNKNRASNFELLRIVSMLLIILHHFVVHSSYNFINNNNSIVNNFFVALFQSGGKFGCVLFAMITGYFMIKSNIKLKKIIMMEGQVLFYSIILFLIFIISGKQIGEGMVIKYFMPNIYKVYWFFSGYFILYLFIPYLNKMLLGLNKKEFLYLLGIGFGYLILLPNIFPDRAFISEVIYLFYYYIIGAYIKLFGDKFTEKKYYLIVFCISYLMMPLFSMFMRSLSISNISLSGEVWKFSRIDSIFIFISSICLFLYFKNLNIKHYKVINLLASLSFGVYLFHEHPLMKKYLWRNLFSIDKFINSSLFIFEGLIIAVIVYMIGSIIEWIRQVIFKYFTKIMKKDSRIKKYTCLVK